MHYKQVENLAIALIVIPVNIVMFVITLRRIIKGGLDSTTLYLSAYFIFVLIAIPARWWYEKGGS